MASKKGKRTHEKLLYINISTAVNACVLYGILYALWLV